MSTAITKVSVKGVVYDIAAVAQGQLYGFFTSSEDLPSDASITGYAFVGETAPFAIYNYNGTTWSDSGATMVFNSIGDINVQSDWNETDITSDAFIQNKPAMPGIVQITRAEYNARKAAGLLDQSLYYFIVDAEAEPIGFTISNESATGAVEKDIAPNVYYVWGEVTSLAITFGTPSTNKIINEYQFEFVSGSTATLLTLPSSVQWSNGIELTPDTNTRYQISVINNIGVWNSVPNE